VVAAVILDEERHCVDPEPREPQFQPEAEHLADLLAHPRVGHIQVGLVVVEAVQVVLAGAFVQCPDAVLLARGRRMPARPSVGLSRHT
jgi:hypothetical protein